MNTRLACGLMGAMLLVSAPLHGQVTDLSDALAARYFDAIAGLSLEQAIARALEQEPSLRAARTQLDVAQAMRQQAGLRPNPAVSFERREEPGGTDSQTTLGIEWPLDLFRRSRRVAVADREISVTQSAVEDRERLLGAEVRMRYGNVLASIRDLGILDELVAVARRQHELVRSSVDEGASPPLDRDLLQVELRRLESDRLVLAGRTDAAVFELKRVLGMSADAPLTVRNTLEEIVLHEAPPPSAGLETTSIVEARADVRAASSRIEAADAEIERARAEGRFDVSLFANYMRMDAGFPQRGFAPDGNLVRVRGQFHNVSGGAMVTIPLLNRNQGEVAAAQAERAGAAAAYEAARLAAHTELAAARARDARAHEAVQLYSAGTQGLARRNLDVVSESRELGRLTIFDLLAEQRRYLDLERAYSSALREAYDARTALIQALGGVE